MKERDLCELFKDLGHSIELELSSSKKNIRYFNKIARRALENFPLPSEPDFDELFQIISRDEYYKNTMISQRNQFSDLAILLYDSEQFSIEAYCWINTSTVIHEHRFLGAFRPWRGKSLVIDYFYKMKNTLNDYTSVGELQISSCTIADKSTTFEITEEEGVAHSIFHLSQPSITLVVRTKNSFSSTYQRNFYSPGLAISPFHIESKSKQLALFMSVVESSPIQKEYMFQKLEGIPKESLCLNFIYWKEVFEGLSQENRFYEIFDKKWNTNINGHSLRRYLNASILINQYRPLVKNEQDRILLGLMAFSGNRIQLNQLMQQCGFDNVDKSLGELLSLLLCEGVVDKKKYRGNKTVLNIIVTQMLRCSNFEELKKTFETEIDDLFEILSFIHDVFFLLKENALFSICWKFEEIPSSS